MKLLFGVEWMDSVPRQLVLELGPSRTHMKVFQQFCLLLFAMNTTFVAGQPSQIPTATIELVAKLDIICYSITVSDGYAYVGRSKFFQVFDLTDPVKPNPLKETGLTYGASGLAISGSNVYAAMSEVGVQKIDISNPAVPRNLDLVFCRAEDLAVVGSTWYTSYGPQGLSILDVSVLGKPVLLGNYKPLEDTHGVAVVDSRAYLAVGSAGIQIVDVSNPAVPRLLGAYDTPGTALDVSVEGSLACVADGKAGVSVLNIEDTANPILLGSIKLTGSSNCVSINYGLIYVSNFYDGLFVLRYTGPK